MAEIRPPNINPICIRNTLVDIGSAIDVPNTIAKIPSPIRKFDIFSSVLLRTCSV
jgi:hypothetical protein